MTSKAYDKFVADSMTKGGRPVPGRLQTALALLERLVECPSPSLADHLAESRQSLLSHETFGNRATERLGLGKLNKNHGRRSSNIQDWGQRLIDLAVQGGFTGKNPEPARNLQALLAATLTQVAHSDPLSVRVRGRTAQATVADILDQAQERGQAGLVGQYLVGAKLQLRFPERKIPVHTYNKGDRRSNSDLAARLADFQIAEAAIEVALGTPDAKHIDQVRDILDRDDTEVWLLVRQFRLESWRKELEVAIDGSDQRVVVAAIEAFVGQNITELGEFSAQGKSGQLKRLIETYNDVWAAQHAQPSLRIVIKP